MRIAKPANQTRLLDRLFVGGCTLAYALLIGSVLAALRMVTG